jgi:hypothetical protein
LRARVIVAVDADIALFGSCRQHPASADLTVISDAMKGAVTLVGGRPAARRGEVGAPQRRGRWFCHSRKRRRVMPDISSHAT